MTPNLRRRLFLAATLITLAAASAHAELMYATNGSAIVRFDSATPTSVTSATITGLQSGETIVGIDLRPATGQVYGVGSSSRLYTINPLTGAATQVGTAGAFTLNGSNFGVDFNPSVDRIRLVSNNEQNLRLNPNDGSLTATDTPLNPAGNVVAAAYTNSVPGATSTTLYAIDSASGNLVIISPPNAGLITVIGSLGLGTNLIGAIGFDISGLTGVAYAAISMPITAGTVDGIVPVSTNLYTINLATGEATRIGTIAGDVNALPFGGLTAATVPEPSTYALLGAGALLFVFRARLRRAKS